MRPPSVRLGDGIDGLLSLAAGSAALILSDLPSGETAAEFDRRPDLVAFWRAAWRAVGPQGQIVLMASSIRFASALIASEPRRFRYDIVWEKSLAVGFFNARHRPLRAHEFVLVFFVKKGTYHPQMIRGAGPIHANSRERAERSTLVVTESYGKAKSVRGVARAGATDRYPRSVVRFGSIPTSTSERTHPQQKPVALLRMLVRQYSNPGDMVIDPFAGSGSTGEAALAEGRRFRGWDSSLRFGSPP